MLVDQPCPADPPATSGKAQGGRRARPVGVQALGVARARRNRRWRTPRLGQRLFEREQDRRDPGRRRSISPIAPRIARGSIAARWRTPPERYRLRLESARPSCFADASARRGSASPEARAHDRDRAAYDGSPQLLPPSPNERDIRSHLGSNSLRRRSRRRRNRPAARLRHGASLTPLTEIVVANPPDTPPRRRRHPRQSHPRPRASANPRPWGADRRRGLRCGRASRVDEDRHHDRGGLRLRLAHQDQVPFVERAHRREPARPALGAQSVHSFAQGNDGSTVSRHRPSDKRLRDPAPSRPRPPKKPQPTCTRTALTGIVFANEKGGTGKSTTAVHVAVALAIAGERSRRSTSIRVSERLTAISENRAEPRRREIRCPLPSSRSSSGSIDPLEAAIDRRHGDLLGQRIHVVFDTPGRDDPLSPAMSRLAPTPGHADQRQLRRLRPDRPGRCRELQGPPAVVLCRTDLGRAQERAASKRRREMNWVVVRNRLAAYRGAQRCAASTRRSTELSKRVGFRVAHGLHERVIYRELFPSGLTLLDMGHRRAPHQPPRRPPGIARTARQLRSPASPAGAEAA